MQALRAFSLCLLCSTGLLGVFAAQAQRGGAGSARGPAGGWGGAVQPGAGLPRLTAPARPGGLGGVHLAPAPRSGALAAGQTNAFGNNFSMFPAPGITSTRPVTFSNGIARYGEPERQSRPARGRLPGYGAGGLFTFGYPLYLGAEDPGLEYAPEALQAAENPALLSAPVYRSAPDAFNPRMDAAGERAGQGAPEEEDASSFPARQAGAERHAASSPARAPAPLPEPDAVTIVFKDGRPPEQIRSYALTRTALYVTTSRVRTIPIEQIDLPATEKINEKAGVEFHLP